MVKAAVYVTVMRFSVICNWSSNYSFLKAFYWIGPKKQGHTRGGGGAVLLCKVNIGGEQLVQRQAHAKRAVLLRARRMIHTRSWRWYNVGSKVASGLIALIHNGCL